MGMKVKRTERSEKIIKLCKLSVEKWGKKLQLKTYKGFMQSQSINIRWGIAD
jgi:hypothetical protein